MGMSGGVKGKMEYEAAGRAGFALLRGIPNVLFHVTLILETGRVSYLITKVTLHYKRVCYYVIRVEQLPTSG